MTKKEFKKQKQELTLKILQSILSLVSPITSILTLAQSEKTIKDYTDDELRNEYKELQGKWLESMLNSKTEDEYYHGMQEINNEMRRRAADRSKDLPKVYWTAKNRWEN